MLSGLPYEKSDMQRKEGYYRSQQPVKNFTFEIDFKVADVEKSIVFYEKAFGFERKFITPDKDYGELLTGNTSIAFASITLVSATLKQGFTESSLEQKPFAIELGLVTDAVAETIQQACNMSTDCGEPRKNHGGQTVCLNIRDIDGFSHYENL
ncbi:hypothetical protein FQR65_LT19950 [Abscondita terminalis]|nr:hypothetical protein FQR65_LT19950 [Abscondita terminalis]